MLIERENEECCDERVGSDAIDSLFNPSKKSGIGETVCVDKIRVGDRSSC